MKRTALVTGGNRGIGLAACRALAGAGVRVVVSARVESDAHTAAAMLEGEGCDVRPFALDVAQPDAAETLAAHLSAKGEAIDILVNNAGVYAESTALDASEAEIMTSLDVNLMGAWRTCRAFLPSMIERGWGRVVNVSSNYGSVGEGLEGPAAYSVTKAALNALTIKLAQTLPVGVKVNAMCPGWVRTRMGGEGATRSPEEAVDTLVWLATLDEDGPSGGFFRDRGTIPW